MTYPVLLIAALAAASSPGSQTREEGADEAMVEARAQLLAPDGMIAEAAEAIGPFDATRDAAADLDAALAAARTSGKHVLVVFGGGWCHDSLALVAALTTPRASASMISRYETVWVDVPYSLDERSIPVAQRLGLGAIAGTPTVLILRPDGTPINLADAPGWRNAASRKPAAIVRTLERAAPVPRGA